MLHRLCVEYHGDYSPTNYFSILAAQILEVSPYVALRGTQTLECYLLSQHS